MKARNLSRVVVAASPIQGSGVFATTAIPSGSVVLQLDDSRVVDNDRPVRPENGESPLHLDYLPDGTVVLMRSPECFINHSCQPNSYIYSVNCQRYLIAKCDIALGEEVLVDYALNAVDGDWWECRCEASSCRRYHKCDFFELPTTLQCEYLPYLDPWFASTHVSRIQSLLASVEDS